MCRNKVQNRVCQVICKWGWKHSLHAGPPPPIKLEAVIIASSIILQSYVLASSLGPSHLHGDEAVFMCKSCMLSAYLALQLVSEDSISDHPLSQSLRITCMQQKDSCSDTAAGDNLLLLECSNLPTLFAYFLVCHPYTLLRFVCLFS